MKVDSKAVAAIELRFARAYDQLVTLENEIKTYCAAETRSYAIRSEVNHDGSEHLLRFQLLKPVPLIWSVMLGEAVHNMRSSLDQIVYWLSIDYSGHPIDRSGFPIYTRKTRRGQERGFHPGGAEVIRGVGPGPRAFIEKVQPYPQRNGPLLKSLLMLHELWNQDKHRLVHIFQLIGRPHEVRVSQRVAPERVIRWFNPRPLKDGAVLARFTVDPPDPQMEVHGEFRFDVVFKIPGKYKRSAPVTLLEMWYDCGAVLGRLMLALGRQDAQIE